MKPTGEVGVTTEPSLQSLTQHLGSRLLAEESVNRILIKCPTTGKMIYTGFSMDPQTFEASPIEEMDPVQCPACRQLHRWTKKDARFERDPNE